MAVQQHGEYEFEEDVIRTSPVSPGESKRVVIPADVVDAWGLEAGETLIFDAREGDGELRVRRAKSELRRS